jgi:hypothetical protein
MEDEAIVGGCGGTQYPILCYYPILQLVPYGIAAAGVIYIAVILSKKKSSKRKR